MSADPQRLPIPVPSRPPRPRAAIAARAAAVALAVIAASGVAPASAGPAVGARAGAGAGAGIDVPLERAGGASASFGLAGAAVPEERPAHAAGTGPRRVRDETPGASRAAGAPAAVGVRGVRPSPGGSGVAAAAAAGQAAEPASTPQVVEGDILVAPAPSVAGRRAVGTSAPGRLWTHGEVPYVIDVVLPAAGVSAVEAAVARWNAIAGITLRRHAPADAPRDHLVFRDGPGCASWVGRQGGPQEVWVGPTCTSGSVMHEIGHALGLEHEHTRSDRDAHLRVHWDRILPEKRHNFETAPPDARLLGDYDLESIMHYGPTTFSSDGRPTLEPLDPAAGARMGQRVSPSEGDIAAIARLYASDLALELQLDDERATREVTLFVTNDHRQGAHEVVVSLSADGLDVVSQIGDASAGSPWRCEALPDGARCTLERLAGFEQRHVTLGLAAPIDGSTLLAAVRSKTPDVDPANNGEAPPGSGPSLGAARGALADAALGETLRDWAQTFETRTVASASSAPQPAAAFGAADDGGSGGGAIAPPLLLGLWLAARRRRRHCSSGTC